MIRENTAEDATESWDSGGGAAATTDDLDLLLILCINVFSLFFDYVSPLFPVVNPYRFCIKGRTVECKRTGKGSGKGAGKEDCVRGCYLSCRRSRD